MNRAALVAIAMALAATVAVDAKTQRSAAAKNEFKRQNPCPATGRPTGKCPGYVIDHVQPLCAGGPDAPSNMQWQTLPDSKVKDAEERRQCRALKRAPSPT